MAIRWLSRLARRVAVTLSSGGRLLPAGAGAGERLSGAAGALHYASRPAARAALGLQDDLPVLLAPGRQPGGRTRSTRQFAPTLVDLLALAQVVHLCGPHDEAALQAEREALPSDLRGRYHLHAYLHEGMTDALVAADLAVSRGGASILGEFPAAQLAAGDCGAVSTRRAEPAGECGLSGGPRRRHGHGRRRLGPLNCGRPCRRCWTAPEAPGRDAGGSGGAGPAGGRRCDCERAIGLYARGCSMTDAATWTVSQYLVVGALMGVFGLIGFRRGGQSRTGPLWWGWASPS